MKTPRLPFRKLISFGTYAVVGAMGTAVHYVLLILLVSGFGVRPTSATLAGALAGALVNFILNSIVTFGVRPSLSVAVRFLTVAAAGAGLNWLAMYLLNTILGVGYLAAQVVATLAILIFTYVVNAAWSFGPRVAAGGSLPVTKGKTP
ncbi:GtrA family protein [Ciceribacter sp. L1K23]|uniref:GtrA family protein n=1 Tax=Ciceribacter sp. L1K23 TaxID=2820276 RepID=UPI001B830E3E|nr:GtrA family protein [Ciceribacter sp. L1K23]MBR0555827.1 GtrA family protein [Ciceribacter sp. L1K23]